MSRIRPRNAPRAKSEDGRGRETDRQTRGIPPINTAGQLLSGTDDRDRSSRTHARPPDRLIVGFVG